MGDQWHARLRLPVRRRSQAWPAAVQPGGLDRRMGSGPRLPLRGHAAGRWAVPLGLAASSAFIALLVGDLIAAANQWDAIGPNVGTDFDVLMDATRRWLNGGSFYADYQLAGPYSPFGPPSILYPPPSLLLFLPFTVLPGILWWVIPIAIVVGVVISHRPQPIAWPDLAMCVWFPTTTEVVYAGNPAIWVVAAIALATRIQWLGVLVFIKPSLFPFALIGSWRRSWWRALAILALVCVPFGGLWLDYATVALNARDPNGILYSLNQVPTTLIPVVAWLGGRYPPRFLAQTHPKTITQPDI